MASAALLSACGGGDVNGDLFVSVEQFESGGAGFFIHGTGGDLRVVSNGIGINGDIVNVQPSGSTRMQAPYEVVTSVDDTERITPSGWENPGRVARQSRIVSGVLKADGRVLSTISSMLYTMEEGESRAHLSMTFSLSTSDSTEFGQALAAFFGCTSTVVRNNNSGNSNYYGNSYWQYTNNNRRVVFPDSSGISLHVWFDFHTGVALSQMVGAVAADTTTQDNTIDNGYIWGNNSNAALQRGPTTEGAIFTSSNGFFRKIIN